MPSEYIAVVRTLLSKKLVATLNPDDDAQLDNPRWLLIQHIDREPVALIKLKRDDYMQCRSFADLAEAVERAAPKVEMKKAPPPRQPRPGVSPPSKAAPKAR